MGFVHNCLRTNLGSNEVLLAFAIYHLKTLANITLLYAKLRYEGLKWIVLLFIYLGLHKNI